MAMKNTATWMRERKDNGTPNELIAYLERIYGDPNIQDRAIQRLQRLRQKDDQTFEKFLPSFEREMADAGALDWPDRIKKGILLSTLNKKTYQALAARGVPSDFPSLIQVLHQISTDMAGFQASFGREAYSSNIRSRREESVYDQMDWTPTVQNTNRRRNSNESVSSDEELRTKRAKWVSPEEIRARRREGRCLRCGRSECRASRCPLQPAVNPLHKKVTKAAVEEGPQKEPRKERNSEPRRMRKARASCTTSASGSDSETNTESSMSEKE
ncbi:hypothetical protein VI817_007186 [Penicillium citrinum]|nr:hypothetical protein VI817_007186 [Penicillium citrinum]